MERKLICPECAQGKPQNCCKFVLDANDDMVPCGTVVTS